MFQTWNIGFHIVSKDFRLQYIPCNRGCNKKTFSVKSNCSKIRTIHHCWDENSSIFNVAVDSKSNRDSVAVENSSILNSLEWENSSILRKNITPLEIINKVVQKIINGMEELIS